MEKYHIFKCRILVRCTEAIRNRSMLLKKYLIVERVFKESLEKVEVECFLQNETIQEVIGL